MSVREIRIWIRLQFTLFRFLSLNSTAFYIGEFVFFFRLKWEDLGLPAKMCDSIRGVE